METTDEATLIGLSFVIIFLVAVIIKMIRNRAFDENK